MKIEKTVKETIRKQLTEESAKHIKNGKPSVPLTIREELAKQYEVSVSMINKILTEEGITWQRQWTEAERKDIWTNYESQGAMKLAVKYDTTPRAIVQQFHLMNKAEAGNPNPWQKI